MTAKARTVQKYVTAITHDQVKHKCLYERNTAYGGFYRCSGKSCKTKACDVYVIWEVKRDHAKAATT